MAITVLLDSDEITAEVYRIEFRRGRSLESENFDPGGGVISVRNYSANFNPFFLVDNSKILLEDGNNSNVLTDENGEALLDENGDPLYDENGAASSNGFLLQETGYRIILEDGNFPTYGELTLGRKVTVKDGTATIFTGYLEDVDYVYEAGGYTEATLTVRDSLATLGATDLLEWITTEGQLTGARVSALLDRSEVGFPTGASVRDIATGTQPLNSSTIRFGTNALQELQQVNRAEYGRLFVDASGKLVFQDRYAVYGVTPVATFDDTGAGLPIGGIDIRFGTELLHFSISVTREGNQWTIENDENGDPIYVNDNDAATERTAENAALIAEYNTLGVRHKTYAGLPYLSNDHATGLAKFLLERYASFSAVISGLTIKLGGLSTSDRATVCGLDIGDVVQVTWSPTGTSGTVSQTLAIEAVNYMAFTHENTASISFQLSDATDPDYFQVGTDSVDGPKFVAP